MYFLTFIEKHSVSTIPYQEGTLKEDYTANKINDQRKNKTNKKQLLNNYDQLKTTKLKKN